MDESGPAVTELNDVAELHRWIDRHVAPLERLHAERLQCREGCHDCCVDDLTVFEVEAEEIRRHAGELLREGRPHPPGGCAFLGDRGQCRIYAVRPYVCRTQGLPLRWLAEDEDEAIVEQRDICPLNVLPAEPVERLKEETCWAIGPVEATLQRLQADCPRPDLRLSLRSLFPGHRDEVAPSAPSD
ncbi:MAG: YkgJ family cysteine cluster protein [Acidobacteriota bacterium]|nr:YkgJ family cysteine cluster protein [Acidobacteriota bacterium]MDH3785155.1 YkgJ family cysteine cluster protein [Acidobacteriota bacterium]